MRESEVYPWLQKHGFQTPAYQIIDASGAINANFYPAVLKIDSPQVTHKSDVGGVIFPLSNHAETNEARLKMVNNLQKNGIEFNLETDRFILSEMVFGIELFAGMVHDPSFGKVIVFGSGGTTVELDQDICFISIEADRTEIKRAVLSTKISKIFLGFRNLNCSLEALLDWLEHFQDFLRLHPSIEQLDFNPLILHDNQFTIVDARVSLTKDTQELLQEEPDHRPYIFDNQNIAIVGASANDRKVGYALAKNALSYPGKLFLVNPKGGEIEGHEILQNLNEIQDNIDMAVLSIPQSAILTTIQELITKRVKNIIIISAGFKECGAIEIEQTLQRLAKEHSINIIGPNCLGYYHGNSGLNATFATSDIKPGSLALVSQSGAVLSSLMDIASEQKIGFSHLLSLGNMANTDFATILPMLDQDPACEAISLYIEGMDRGQSLLRALRSISKPVCIYKSGQSTQAQQAAFSHTGNLCGDYRMFRALMHSVGAKVLDTFQSLLYHRSKTFEKILILTNGGGPGTMLTDLIISRGKSLYSLSDEQLRELDSILPPNWSKNNPVDIIGDADHERFKKSLEIIENFTNLDLVFLLITPQQMTDPLMIVKMIKKTANIPVIPILLGGKLMHSAEEFLRTERMIYFKSLNEAVTVLV